jgi:hypothetical protein
MTEGLDDRSTQKSKTPGSHRGFEAYIEASTSLVAPKRSATLHRNHSKLVDKSTIAPINSIAQCSIPVSEEATAAGAQPAL